MPSIAAIKTDRYPGPAGDGAGLESALAFGLRLVASVESFAAAFASDELGDIELPPEVGSAADQAALRTAASLYLSCELEVAGLLPAVELLTALFASGGLSVATGSAADKLAVFWQGRHERFTVTERRAIFARVFGAELGAGLAGDGGSNQAFDSLMTGLADALFRWEGNQLWRPSTGPREETRVRMAAYQLAVNLLPRSEGMMPFAARDILTTLQQALDILKELDVQALFGAQSVWATIRNIHRRYRHDLPEIASHLMQGQSGQTVLAWLADVVPRLSNYSTPVLTPDHGAIAAAAAWLQASSVLTGQRVPMPAQVLETERDTKFKIGGGEGPLRQEHESVFNLRPPGHE